MYWMLPRARLRAFSSSAAASASALRLAFFSAAACSRSCRQAGGQQGQAGLWGERRGCLKRCSGDVLFDRAREGGQRGGRDYRCLLWQGLGHCQPVLWVKHNCHCIIQALAWRDGMVATLLCRW